MTISIITPVFNREDCILRCMESVTKSLDFLYSNGGGKDEIQIEQVIVDDGSKDDTANIVRDYAANHQHVKFFAFPENRGTNAARNKAINEAKGEWITLLDSDDYYTENALKVISSTILQKPDYKHYTFGCSDVKIYYQNNPIINGTSEKVLTYPDFLNGYINCDFVHVLRADTMRRHPFDEKLRIYEGIWFMMFYRDAQRILFTNKVIDIVEQGRSDSVSYEFMRTSKVQIERAIKGGEVFLENFEDDMQNLGMHRRLYSTRAGLLDNYALKGDYPKAKELIKNIGKPKSRKDKLDRMVIYLHISFIYRNMRKAFLIMKYKVLNKDIRRF